MKRVILVLLALSLAAGMAFAAPGREGGAGDGLGDYPNKPIRIIVPYAPGGGTDVFVRTMLKYVDIKQNMAVVNIEGAGGLVGAMEGYHAPNDGYTLIAHNPMEVIGYTLSNMTQIPLWSELEMICWAVTDYMATFVGKQTGFKTIEDVVAYAKANPGQLQWGTVGARTINNIMAQRTIEGMGLTGLVTVVPYESGAQARTALLGGHVQVCQASLGDLNAIIQSGDAIPVVLVSPDRTKLAPNVPTAAEKGLKGIDLLICRGFYAPKGTNPAIVRFLEAAFKAAAENPEFVSEINRFSSDSYFVPGAEAFRRCQEAYNLLKPYY